MPGADPFSEAMAAAALRDAGARETLTVLVVTFRHERWIDGALASVAAQQDVVVDRVLVSDDGSDDGTVEAAREAGRRYGLPVEIRSTSRRLGVCGHYADVLPRVGTDLVAVLEGDDLWVDRHKLARQCEVLADYPVASGCGVTLVPFHDTTGMVDPTPVQDGAVAVLGARDLALGGGFGSFSAMVYRTSALATVDPGFFRRGAADWLLNVLLARHGPLLHLRRAGTAYRLSSQGSWQRRTTEEQRDYWIAHIDANLPYVPADLAALLQQKRLQLLAEPALARLPARLRRSSLVEQTVQRAVKARTHRTRTPAPSPVALLE